MTMRGIRKTFRDEAGMTLVEVMVSAVILFIVGLIGYFSIGIERTRKRK